MTMSTTNTSLPTTSSTAVTAEQQVLSVAHRLARVIMQLVATHPQKVEEIINTLHILTINTENFGTEVAGGKTQGEFHEPSSG